ncbi:MAG: hypothetical protein V4574_14775 [Pseudomonadota bacterium]
MFERRRLGKVFRRKALAHFVVHALAGLARRASETPWVTSADKLKEVFKERYRILFADDVFEEAFAFLQSKSLVTQNNNEIIIQSDAFSNHLSDPARAIKSSGVATVFNDLWGDPWGMSASYKNGPPSVDAIAGADSSITYLIQNLPLARLRIAPDIEIFDANREAEKLRRSTNKIKVDPSTKHELKTPENRDLDWTKWGTIGTWVAIPLAIISIIITILIAD